jgi:hypothetical protein
MKIMAMLFLCYFSLFAQNQTAEGSHAIGGNFSFSSTHFSGRTSSVLTISPEASVFLADNLELGASLSTQFAFDGGTNAVWGIGPYFNCYFTNNPEKPFVGIQYSYSYYDYGQNGNSGNGLTLQGGFLLPVNEKVAVLPVVQFKLMSTNQPQSVFQVVVGASLKVFL